MTNEEKVLLRTSGTKHFGVGFLVSSEKEFAEAMVDQADQILLNRAVYFEGEFFTPDEISRVEVLTRGQSSMFCGGNIETSACVVSVPVVVLKEVSPYYHK